MLSLVSLIANIEYGRIDGHTGELHSLGSPYL